MTARIEPIRRAAALPARTPEREALRQALERRDEAKAELERYEAARAEAALRRRAAERVIDEARSAIADARESAPSRLADQLLQGVDDIGDDDAIGKASAQLSAAEFKEQTTAEAVRLIDAEIPEKRQRAHLAEMAVDRCIGAVLRAEAFPVLIARFQALRHEVVEMSLMFGEISVHAPPDFHYDAVPTFRDVSRAGADMWKGAVAALARDADAPLPLEPPGNAPSAA